MCVNTHTYTHTYIYIWYVYDCMLVQVALNFDDGNDNGNYRWIQMNYYYILNFYNQLKRNRFLRLETTGSKGNQRWRHEQPKNIQISPEISPEIPRVITRSAAVVCSSFAGAQGWAVTVETRWNQQISHVVPILHLSRAPYRGFWINNYLEIVWMNIPTSTRCL